MYCVMVDGNVISPYYGYEEAHKKALIAASYLGPYSLVIVRKIVHEQG